jgi:hypothetical protein
MASHLAHELNYQMFGMTGHDVHAVNYHWLTSVVLALLLIMAGSLAATKRQGGMCWAASLALPSFTWEYSTIPGRLCRELGKHRWSAGNPWWPGIHRRISVGGT